MNDATLTLGSCDNISIHEGGSAYRRFILWLLQNHFRVMGVVWTYAGRINLIGRKSDVVFAQYLFSWLMDHFQLEWKSELKKRNKGEGRRSSVAFFYGMYKEINESLVRAKKEVEESRIDVLAREKVEADYGSVKQEEDVESSSNVIRSTCQLALISEKDALEEEYYKLHPDLRSRRGTSVRVNHNALSMAAGRAAGARTRIPGIPLNNSTRSALA